MHRLQHAVARRRRGAVDAVRLAERGIAPLAEREPRLIVFGTPGLRLRAYGRHREALAATCRSLGLRRIRHTVQHDDTPTIRGMLARVPYCIEVKEEA